jgi:orotate phosphoribosyltransferase
VEDLATDGGSKVVFCNALRAAGTKVDHVFVIFYYDIFPNGGKVMTDIGIKLHALATWRDVLPVAKANGTFPSSTLDEVEKFMHDPRAWSLAHGGTTGAGAE